MLLESRYAMAASRAIAAACCKRAERRACLPLVAAAARVPPASLGSSRRIAGGCTGSGAVTTPTSERVPCYKPDMELDKTTQTELEAAAFRRLVEHLRQRSD